MRFYISAYAYAHTHTFSFCVLLVEPAQIQSTKIYSASTIRFGSTYELLLLYTSLLMLSIVQYVRFYSAVMQVGVFDGLLAQGRVDMHD